MVRNLRFKERWYVCVVCTSNRGGRGMPGGEDGSKQRLTPKKRPRQPSAVCKNISSSYRTEVCHLWRRWELANTVSTSTCHGWNCWWFKACQVRRTVHFRPNELEDANHHKAYCLTPCEITIYKPDLPDKETTFHFISIQIIVKL